jgi:hypothetical protein
MLHAGGTPRLVDEERPHHVETRQDATGEREFNVQSAGLGSSCDVSAAGIQSLLLLAAYA